MGREGLMDDTGYKAVDAAAAFFENFCEECKCYNPYEGECSKHGLYSCNGDDYVNWREAEGDLRGDEYY